MQSLLKRLVLFMVVFFFCAQVSQWLSLSGGPLSAWLPAGLYLGVLLLSPTKDWLWLALAALPAEFLFGCLQRQPVALMAGFYLADSVQAVAGAWLIRRFVSYRPELKTLNEFWGLLGFGAILSPALGGAIGSATLMQVGASHSFLRSFAVWWSINGTAVLTFSPFVLVWFSQPTNKRHRLNSAKGVLEAAVFISTTMIVNWAVLSLAGGIFSPFKVPLIPLLIYSGIRLRREGASLAGLLVAMELTLFTTHFTQGVTASELSSGKPAVILFELLAVIPFIALVPALALAERDQITTKLRKSERRFRTLVEKAPVALNISRNGKTIYVNQKYLDLYGYQRTDELIGQQITEQWAPEYRALVADRAERRARGEQAPGYYEGMAQRRDGSQFPVTVSVGMVELPDGPASLGVLSDISEQKRAEAAATLFRVLIDHATDAIEVVDPESGRLLDVNQEAARLHGYTREEYLSLTVKDIDPKIANGELHWNDLVAEVAARGRILLEMEHRRKDGTTFPVEINATYIRLERDYVLGVVRDITARKRSEQDIRRLNRVYAMVTQINELIARDMDRDSLLTAACSVAVEPGGFRMAWIGMADTTAKVIRPVASDGAEDGYLETVDIDLTQAGQRQGPTARALLSGEHQLSNDIENDPAMEPWKEQALRRGYRASAAFPLKARGKTAGVFSLYADEVDFFNADEMRLLDTLAVDIGFGIEVTEKEAARRRAEGELRASEERFRELAETIDEVFWITSPCPRQVLYISPAYEHIWGRPCQDLYENPNSWLESVHPDDRERIAAASNKQLCGQLYEEEYRIVRPDMQIRWIRDVSFSVHDAAGKLERIVGVAHDVTERRMISEQLRQSQKMEAIGQLAGGVAHDFNNIIGAIMMQVELLLYDAGISKHTVDGLQLIRDAAERAANLTRQLLLFSRKQVMQSSDLDLNEVVSNLSKMLHRVIGEDIGLKLNLSHRPLMTRADAGMLDQILMNLAVNARDAMPDGGSLVIETTEVLIEGEVEEREPDVKPGPYVCLAVSDTGMGIPAEVLPRIFEPFFTTKEAGKGTGLGLATVFGIVKQHHGFVRVESEPGAGARFRILLPATEAAAGAMPSAANARANGGTERVLLVEDEAPMRAITRAVLEHYGYGVIECADGPEALAQWAKHCETIAVLLTDMVMPGGLSGKELAKLLKEDKPELKVVFISGYSAEVAGQEIGLKLGENFLQKPFKPLQLLEMVRKSLDG